MRKRRVIKSDGRYIIYYAFDRPLPEVEGARAPGGAGDEEAGQAAGRSSGELSGRPEGGAAGAEGGRGGAV